MMSDLPEDQSSHRIQQKGVTQHWLGFELPFRSLLTKEGNIVASSRNGIRTVVIHILSLREQLADYDRIRSNLQYSAQTQLLSLNICASTFCDYLHVANPP